VVPFSRQWRRLGEEWGTAAELGGLRGASSGGSLRACSCGSQPCCPPSAGDPRRRPPPPCSGCGEPRF